MESAKADPVPVATKRPGRPRQRREGEPSAAAASMPFLRSPSEPDAVLAEPLRVLYAHSVILVACLAWLVEHGEDAPPADLSRVLTDLSQALEHGTSHLRRHAPVLQTRGRPAGVRILGIFFASVTE